jgi:DNA-binding CsgD family transcriptional regulator
MPAEPDDEPDGDGDDRAAEREQEPPCPHARGTALTPRELDVMRLVADDHTSQEIGRILLISPRD